MSAVVRRIPGMAFLAALALVAGCAGGPADRPVAEGDDPHGALACAECHDGGLADGRRLAAVPVATCTGSGCHSDGVPGEVALGQVSFAHRDHAANDSLAVGCAGCHTHADGDEPVSAGAGTCGLCHQDALSGASVEDCRVCHQTPTHTGTTSQGVPVAHEGLPWIEGGCLRCHYEVTQPVSEVEFETCAACHEDVQAQVREAGDEDLHPGHTQVSCTACHTADNHRIQAMSSAVSLQCATCHVEEHDVRVADGTFPSISCNQCHQETHAPPQRLLLGLAFADAQPAAHFSAGLTCASCHAAPDGAAVQGGASTAQACVDCHRPEYATVRQWWEQGVTARTRMVARYLSAAEGALGASAEGLSGARDRLTLVEEGHGQHNLPLTHRLLETAVQETAQAWRDQGRTAPTPPALGRAPRTGLCTFCHYRVDEPGMTEEMDDAFHRAVMGR